MNNPRLVTGSQGWDTGHEYQRAFWHGRHIHVDMVSMAHVLGDTHMSFAYFYWERTLCTSTLPSLPLETLGTTNGGPEAMGVWQTKDYTCFPGSTDVA